MRNRLLPRPKVSVSPPSRRDVLRYGFTGLGLMMTSSWFIGCGETPTRGSMSNIENLGPLGEPDENGIRLPAGFRSRVVARSGEPVAGTSYVWHGSPDGGAIFPTRDGGWIYVSNSEIIPNGGAGALRFDRFGEIVDAYRILGNTALNCAGGPTPWGTWLSCEEFEGGRVWECDPYGIEAAVPHPALGIFQHEAVAVDAAHGQLYLTEDRGDGRFYRFSPARSTDGRLDLSEGALDVAHVAGEEGAVTWLPVPDPSATSMPIRMQVPESTAFRGGEGIWYRTGTVWFTTKGDNRIWGYDTIADTMHIVYDDDLFTPAELTGVDNVVASNGGDILVAEDGGNMQIVAYTPLGTLVPLVQIEGQPLSEVTGPAFDPSGTRLYFSSQRGPTVNFFTGGITYEVTGPFVT